MKQVKEYRIDGKEPTDEEFKECIDIVNSEDCIVRLIFGYRSNGMPNAINIPVGATFEKLKNVYEENKYAFNRQ